MLDQGRLVMVDEQAFRRELAEVMQAVDRDYEALAVRQRPAIPYLLQANKALKHKDLGLNRFVGQVE